MVVTEMRTAHVPVKVLGLDVEREAIRNDAIERVGDGDRVPFRQIRGRLQRANGVLYALSESS